MAHRLVHQHPVLALLAWVAFVTGCLVVFVSLIHFANSSAVAAPRAHYTTFERQTAIVETLNQRSHFDGARFYWHYDHLVDGLELVMEGSPRCEPDFLAEAPPDLRQLVIHGDFARFSCHYLDHHLQLWVAPGQEAPFAP